MTGERLPGERADGSFAASLSKRLPGRRDAGHRHVVARFTAALGAEPESTRDDASPTWARWAQETGSIVVTVDVAGVGKLRVTATHEGLRDPDEVAPATERLRTILWSLTSA